MWSFRRDFELVNSCLGHKQLKNEYARLAQLVEHSTDTRAVPGSNPGSRTTHVYL
jgi:hypothetical protein